MSEHVRIEVAGPVMTLRIDRPEKKNAITSAMYTALSDGLDRAGGDAAIRVVVIAGSSGMFTSGNDLEDFLGATRIDGDTPIARFLHTLSVFEKPLVAAVAGPAVGIGTTMLLHCDLAYAADTAVLQMPFVSLGLVPEAASSLLLPQLVGMAKAAELLYFGASLGAAEAERLGIVNGVVAADRLEAHVAERAAALARQPAAAVRATKRLLRRSAAGTVAERIAEESAIFSDRLRSPEAVEAITAFMEKRKPDFSRFD